MMYNRPAVCCPGIVYPNQLNRVERVRFEGDLQGLENGYFHCCCLSLRGGAVTQQLWPLAELSMLSLFDFVKTSQPRPAVLVCFPACIMKKSSPDYERVIKYCDLVVGEQPENYKAHFRKAQALYELGRYDGALTSFLTAKEHMGAVSGTVSRPESTDWLNI